MDIVEFKECDYDIMGKIHSITANTDAEDYFSNEICFEFGV